MTELDPTSPLALAAAATAGDRRALARLITLIESTRADHRRAAEAALEHLAPRVGGAVRLGITGVPGVGKSTFIESFGLTLAQQGRKVAVLAVDPSSRRTGGSILGDKTRMAELSCHPNAFIRPSPAGATLGGVARRTAETALAVEACGYDVVIVETVGVGQSETAVADMTDMFLLLLPPGGGDELQGIKKGVVELADLVIVNKADGDLAPAAGRAAADYASALHLIRPATPFWRPTAVTVSAMEKRGLPEVWAKVEAFRAAMTNAGLWESRRADQAERRLWSEVGEALVDALRADPAVGAALPALEARVRAGTLPPSAAARRLLSAFLHRSADDPGP